MPWGLLSFAAVVIFGVGIILRRRWQLESLRDVPAEVMARNMPEAAVTRQQLNRVLKRRLQDAAIMLPSRKKLLPAEVGLPMNPEDYENLVADGGIAAIERDLRDLLLGIAKRGNWERPGNVSVRLLPDSNVLPGRVGPVRREQTLGSVEVGVTKKLVDEQPESPRAALRQDVIETEDLAGITGPASPATKRLVSDKVRLGNLVLSPEYGSAIEVTAGAIIGRDGECELRINHERVSRRHAEVRRDGNGWSIRDLGSTHGTYLNGEAVGKFWILLKFPVVIRLGESGPKIKARISGE
ncbi:FHA domain-containing protein [Buchananella hordeovulneris]|uniref:FHA domain-containing protein n=1 Tax=Buchananella hordeovulneris TaxID=52770 RepID=UPI0026DDB333|nr:FHA domain-containing protein [Buchananella hordeovulneris]MDO5080646.1 FHA domain-containing protein [Buchananella hordeovulneris]